MKIKNIIGDNSTVEYESKVGGDLELVRAKRSDARAYIMANKEEV